MEFQVVNDISSFWSTLVHPILFGAISLFLFLWVIGKENRETLMKRFVDKNNNQYVLQNGIYIPKSQTTKNIFVHNLSKTLGLGSLKPLMIIFVIVLIFFGINQILLRLFQPLLIYNSRGIIYSSGVNDYIIAGIWMHYPYAELGQLYAIIRDLTEDTRHAPSIVQYSVQAFIRFNIVCCIVMLFRMAFRIKKPNWANKKVFMRLLILTFALVVSLALALLFNIHSINNEISRISHEAYFVLEYNRDFYTELGWEIQNVKIETFLTAIEQDRELYEANLFYGAFGLRSNFANFIINSVREFYRFFSIP